MHRINNVIMCICWCI